MNVTLCEKDFYDAVTSTIEVAGELLRTKKDLRFAKKRVLPRKYLIPPDIEYEFSAN